MRTRTHRRTNTRQQNYSAMFMNRSVFSMSFERSAMQIMCVSVWVCVKYDDGAREKPQLAILILSLIIFVVCVSLWLICISVSSNNDATISNVIIILDSHMYQRCKECSTNNPFMCHHYKFNYSIKGCCFRWQPPAIFHSSIKWSVIKWLNRTISALLLGEFTTLKTWEKKMMIVHSTMV